MRVDDCPAGKPSQVHGSAAPVLLTLQEAARRLGMCVPTLRAHVKAGAISYVSVGDGTQRVRRLFTPDDLEAFCDHQRRREVPREGTMRVQWPKELAPPQVYDFTALRASRKKAGRAKTKTPARSTEHRAGLMTPGMAAVIAKLTAVMASYPQPCALVLAS